MNLIAVSAKGWETSPKVITSTLSELALKKVIGSTIIDFDFVKFSINNNHGIYKNMAIYKTIGKGKSFAVFVKSLLADDVVLIDATGASIEEIHALLVMARKLWFHLDAWQPIFAVICDDFDLVKVADMLQNTFYSMPEFITNKEVVYKIKKIQMKAKLLRIFGPLIIVSLNKYSRWFK